jgi:hypothetical protein
LDQPFRLEGGNCCRGLKNLCLLDIFRGSAVVSTAVFGVPPNTLLRRLFLNQSVLDRLFIEIIKAGCGTRDASRDRDGRVPGFTENVQEPICSLTRTLFHIIVGLAKASSRAEP